MKQATQEYRNESDIVQQFVAECGTLGDEERVSSGNLYRAFQNWAKTNRHDLISQTMLGTRLGALVPALINKKARSSDSGRSERTWFGITA